MQHRLDPEEWFKVNGFTLELHGYRSPVLSLYLPWKQVEKARIMLEEKIGTADLVGLKSLIESHLKDLERYSGSICLFGWPENGKNTLKHIQISKELPTVFVTGRRPYLKPLKDILEIGYQVMIIIMDYNKAKIEIFDGHKLIKKMRVGTYLKGRHKKGGWSQKRFSQNRKLQIEGFFEKIVQQIKEVNSSEIDLVLLGGPSLAKKQFLQNLGSLQTKTKIIDGISFETPHQTIMNHVIQALDKFRIGHELELLRNLGKPAKMGLVISRNDEIKTRVHEGAVDTLFIAADYHAESPAEEQMISRIIRSAKLKGSKVEFITGADARRRLHRFGSLVALLRYKT